MSGVPLHHFTVRWGDVDANGHMSNVAYLNIAVDARMAAFTALGFPASAFAELGIGPVIRRDSIEYKRELHLHEAGTVSIELVGLSDDGSRFALRNTFVRHDGVTCAVLDTLGGWLDLVARKLVHPPDALLAAVQALPRAADYATLESSVKAKRGA